MIESVFWFAGLLIVVPFAFACGILGTRAIRNDRARINALRTASSWHRDCRRNDDTTLLETAERLRRFLQGEQ